jgi:DNA (cytosine-5)-methyltransferase 1
MKVLSLFTGAGGFDLGLEAAGFEVSGCVENDPDAIATVRRNRSTWPIIVPGDIHVHEADELLAFFRLEPGEVSVLAAGPPCQPFSKSGYWATGATQRLRDPRARTFSAVLDVVEFSLPEVVLIENVRGISLNKHNDVLDLIENRLNRINKRRQTAYRLQVLHLNAASYGVPQTRERTFLLAHREGGSLQLPKPTHAQNPDPLDETVRRFSTAWDAIGHLEDLASERLTLRGKWADLLPSIPEGQNYLWHTDRGGGTPLFGWRTRYWTFLLKLAKNRPSWTLQAAPGPSTGPFHWHNRLLSVEELCRLQTFPADYSISGSYSSARRQLGNAVPSAIGELFGLEIRRQLLSQTVRTDLSLIPSLREDTPPPEATADVPAKYLALRGVHAPHPGAGLGPGAVRTAT